MRKIYYQIFPLFIALQIAGCGKGPNASKGFDAIPMLIFAGLMIGGLWFIGKLIDKNSNFSDSVLSALVFIAIVAAGLSLLLKLFN